MAVACAPMKAINLAQPSTSKGNEDAFLLLHTSTTTSAAAISSSAGAASPTAASIQGKKSLDEIPIFLKATRRSSFLPFFGVIN